MIGPSINWSGVLLNDGAQHWLTGGHSWWLGTALIDLGSFLKVMTVLQRLQTLITLWFVCPGCQCATYSGTAGRDCAAAIPAWWRHGERLQFLLLLVQLPCTCACLFSAQMPRCVGSACLVVCLNASPNVYARSQGWRGRVSTLGGRACPRLALQKDGQRFVTSSRSSVQFGTLVFFLRLVVLMHADCENGCERKLLTLV